MDVVLHLKKNLVTTNKNLVVAKTELLYYYLYSIDKRNDLNHLANEYNDF